MSWLGKAIGGTIGFALGGPLGAVFGAVIGHQFDKPGETTGRKSYGYTPHEQSQAVFFVATFSLLAKLARADGRVSKEEIQVVENFMRQSLHLDNDAREMAIKIFNTAKLSNDSFDMFAEQFYELFHNDVHLLNSMLELLIRIAAADGNLHENEEKMLKRAALIFTIDLKEYERIKSIYIQNNDKYYAILGVSRTDSNEVIKKKYRQLVLEHHPDRVISKGLPEEFIKIATEKFQEIQEAFEKIMKERNAA
ncbi:MAG TPA: co-chaperone DjlA [bacterium]|nr:co-chaperone DjlA [bacterium]HPN44326.1 co-chaperone DjlA [bacterium]